MLSPKYVPPSALRGTASAKTAPFTFNLTSSLSSQKSQFSALISMCLRLTTGKMFFAEQA
jgi:hypothetical protein